MSVLSLTVGLPCRAQSPAPLTPQEAGLARSDYTSGREVHISYGEAQPILKALPQVLPADLANKPPAEQADAWPQWIAAHDAAIRARLRGGDEDSLVNFLFYGVSFTRQPRLNAAELSRLQQKQDTGSAPGLEASPILQARVGDLLQGLAGPGENERLLFLRDLARLLGYDPDTATGRARLRAYILARVARVIDERQSFAQTLGQVGQQGDPTELFSLYRSRGLSLDTSLFPNFTIEQSLKEMQSRGLIEAGSVRHAAIIGPGLDFTDKQGGYDYSPQQSIQPFALMDTLLRLGLANGKSLEITTFDISPRVNNHLALALDRARRGQSYTLQLTLDAQVQWTPEAKAYWKAFGDQIGVPARPIPLPDGSPAMETRAVQINPARVANIRPVDLDTVTEHLELPTGQAFDLVIATNIFIYYDILDQCLALANVQRMLRTGGYLLSNNFLPILPVEHMRAGGYLNLVYSSRPHDGDHIVWYQRLPD